jgi:hypothetical protein
MNRQLMLLVAVAAVCSAVHYQRARRSMDETAPFHSCMGEAVRICPKHGMHFDVTEHLDCLFQRGAELTGRCSSHLLYWEQCVHDINALCAHLNIEETFECLYNRREELSEACKESHLMVTAYDWLGVKHTRVAAHSEYVTLAYAMDRNLDHPESLRLRKGMPHPEHQSKSEL